MLDVKLIRESTDKVRESMKKRNKDTKVLDDFLSVDNEWRELETEIQNLRKQQKELSGDKKNIERAKENKEKIKKIEKKLKKIEQDRHNLLISIPNIPFDDVPVGNDEKDNMVIKNVGNIPKFSFDIKSHLELGESLDILDVKKASEVSGARFYYLKNEGAILELSLLRFAMDILIENGFQTVIPPIMIRPDVYEKMGRLTPDQKDERYYLQKDDLYLIGSAEHTLGPLQMNETLKEDELPIRYAGFSVCLRREAGSYGKDTSGILRVHQFDKVEMYSFTKPEFSEEEHKFLLYMEERIYQELEIPYQVIAICTGDMDMVDARQFDIEAWVPSQNKYREIASCSNTTDYQTRGINTKIQKGNEKVFAHALNATAIAISRTLIAILENNQQKDGSVMIPKALRKYTGFKKIEL